MDLEKLEEYANLDGSEIGDYVSSLIDVARFSEPHGMSRKFKKSLQEEINHWLNRFENETKIVTTLKPQPDRQVKELLWIDV